MADGATGGRDVFSATNSTDSVSDFSGNEALYVHGSSSPMTPQFYSPAAAGSKMLPRPSAPTDGVPELHYSVKEIAASWGLCENAVRDIFRNEPGVVRIHRPKSQTRRAYTTLRIPRSCCGVRPLPHFGLCIEEHSLHARHLSANNSPDNRCEGRYEFLPAPSKGTILAVRVGFEP